MHRTRARVYISSVLCTFTALGLTTVGCEDTRTRIDRTPILVNAFEYAEPVLTSAGDSVLIRAIVGYGDCKLENAALELRGDSLVVRGNAVCTRVERRSKVLTPPAPPNAQSFRLPFPVLDPGTYVLVAGELADTLTVAPSTLPPQTAHIAALGVSFAADSCAVFQVDAFALEYELLDAPPPQRGRVVRLYATLAGGPICDPRRVASLRTRRLEPIP